MDDFALTPKIMPALRRLHRHYERKEELDFCSLIEASEIAIVEGVEYDNWGGGSHGHNILAYVPEELMGLVDLDAQDDIFERIKSDLNKATSEVENEYVSGFYFKPKDISDPDFQSAVPFTREPRARPDDVGLWHINFLRLFISHRDKEKVLAHGLADALKPFGVSSFVAHDAIKPMKEWREEIMNALQTMEVMLVLLTDDFHESVYTNQEIGFALGKNIPIICVSVCGQDPKGFIETRQAMKVPKENLIASASVIQKTLISEIGQEGRLKGILIEAFIASGSYPDTIETFDRLSEAIDNLTDREFSRICDGYRENDQIHGCGGIQNRNNRFLRYLETATGKKLEVHKKNIREIRDTSGDEIPF